MARLGREEALDPRSHPPEPKSSKLHRGADPKLKSASAQDCPNSRIFLGFAPRNDDAEVPAAEIPGICFVLNYLPARLLIYVFLCRNVASAVGTRVRTK
jgi:hypothetical protein